MSNKNHGIHRVALFLFGAILKLYPTAFRQEFGVQMLADFEDARRDRAKEWNIYWTVCMLTDLIRGAVWSHRHPLPSVQMAVVGGGNASGDQYVEAKQVFSLLRQQVPRAVGFVLMTILAGACLGVGIYDPKSLLLFLVGGGLIGAAAFVLANPIAQYVSKETQGSEMVAKNLWLVVVAITLMGTLNAAIFFITDLAKYFSTISPRTNGLINAFGIDNSFLTGVLTLTLAMSVLPLVFYKTPTKNKHLERLMTHALPLFLGVGGAALCVHNQSGMFLIGAHFLIAGVVMLQMFKPVFAMRLATQIFWGILPMPIMMGFFLAMTFDVGQSRARVDNVGIFRPEVASIWDLSEQQTLAIKQLRQTGDEQQFWEQIEQLKEQRKIIHSTRLWLWMADVQPVQVQALLYCRALANTRHHDALACSQTKDADTWISSHTQAKRIQLPPVVSTKQMTNSDNL